VCSLVLSERLYGGPEIVSYTLKMYAFTVGRGERLWGGNLSLPWLLGGGRWACTYPFVLDLCGGTRKSNPPEVKHGCLCLVGFGVRCVQTLWFLSFEPGCALRCRLTLR
jgi:hypothetical protein